MENAYADTVPLDPGELDSFDLQLGTLARHKMVRKLTDLLVLSQSKLSGNERDFIADILIFALESLEAEVVCEISNRLAGFIEVPVQLQRYLIRHSVTASRPLLAPDCTLQEQLVMEACTLGPEYRQLIAMRDDLQPILVDQLVKFGDVEIIQIILRREECVFSATAMDALVQRSEMDIEIRKLLLLRPELRLEHGLSMFWWLEPKMRKAVLARFATDRAIVQDAMHEMFVDFHTGQTKDPLVQKVLNLVDRRHRPRGRNGEMVEMDVVRRTLKVARLNPEFDFVQAVALLAGTSHKTAEKCLRDISGEAFGILCKSIGVSRTDFQEMFFEDSELGGVAPQFSGEKVDDLVGVFDSISRDFSRTILRYWDWRIDASGAPAPLDSVSIDAQPSGSYYGAV